MHVQFALKLIWFTFVVSSLFSDYNHFNQCISSFTPQRSSLHVVHDSKEPSHLFPLSTISKPKARLWVSNTPQLSHRPFLGVHQETNAECQEQISARGVVMMKMRIFVGWCWNKDCETPEFLTRKSCAGVSEKSPLWLHHHLEAEWPKAGGSLRLQCISPKTTSPSDTGFKTEVGTLEKCAVRHFGAA